MQVAIISTALGIVLFLCLYLGFRTGLRLGMQTSKGQVPPKIDPVGTIQAKKEEAKQAKLTGNLLEGYANMMAYDGDHPKDGGK
mgnify:CR=1 FL=1